MGSSQSFSAGALDLAGVITATTYIALAVTAMVLAYTGTTTLRRLSKAVRLARFGLAAAVLNVIVNFADIPNDGIWWAINGVFIAGTWAYTSRCISKKRAAEGDRVVSDAERTVRSYVPPTWER